MRRIRQSFGQRLLLVMVVLTLLPLVISSAFSVYTSRELSTDSAVTRQQAVLDIGTPYLEQYFSDIFDDLELIGALFDPQSPPSTLAIASLCARTGARYPELSVMDATGQERLWLRSCQVVAEDELRSQASNELFFRANRGEVFVGGVTFPQGAPEPLVQISLRTGRPGGEQFVVAATLGLGSLLDTLGQISLGEGGYIYVVDRRGRLVGYNDPAIVRQERSLVDLPPVAALLGGQAGVSASDYVGLLGEPVLGTSRLVAQVGWGLVLEQPLSTVLAAQSQQRDALLIVIVLALAMVLGGAMLMARSVTRPVQLLAEGAALIAQGDLSHTIPITSNDELGLVTKVVNDMTAQLGATIGDLERRVEERTHKLSTALEIQRQQAEELARSLQAQQELSTAIAQLNAPIIPVQRGVLVVPLVGTFSEERMGQLSRRVLQSIQHERAHTVMIDLTGVAVIDGAIAHALVELASATELLGSHAVIVGIGPEVAQALVSLDQALRIRQTWSTLEQALASLNQA